MSAQMSSTTAGPPVAGLGRNRLGSGRSRPVDRRRSRRRRRRCSLGCRPSCLRYHSLCNGVSNALVVPTASKSGTTYLGIVDCIRRPHRLGDGKLRV